MAAVRQFQNINPHLGGIMPKLTGLPSPLLQIKQGVFAKVRFVIGIA